MKTSMEDAQLIVIRMFLAKRCLNSTPCTLYSTVSESKPRLRNYRLFCKSVREMEKTAAKTYFLLPLL
jgi:hypothetical protein